jgi:hypothetical protein
MKNRLAHAALVVGVAAFAAGWGEPSTAADKGATSAGSAVLPSPFTITARYTPKSLGLRNSRYLTIGPDGNLYVTDGRQRVSVISPRGKLLRRWGKPGNGPGKFRFVSPDPSAPKQITASVAVGQNGMVYVSDSGNARIQVFTPKGRFVRQFGSFGNGKGQFLLPFDLVVDGAGNVYVTDDQRMDLVKFSPSGKVVWRIGGGASADLDLVGHFHVASIDAHGRMVVANDDKGRILYLDRNGHKVDAFGSGNEFPDGACGVTVDRAGSTFVSGCGAGPTLVFDRTHRLVAESRGSTEPLLRSPSFGPRGEVFALGRNGSILKLHITLPRG